MVYSALHYWDFLLHCGKVLGLELSQELLLIIAISAFIKNNIDEDKELHIPKT